MNVEKTVVVSRQADVHQLAGHLSLQVFVADDHSEAIDIIRTTSPDLVLFDYRENTQAVPEFINKGNKYLTNVSVVIVGSENDTDNVLSDKFKKMGAQGYLQLVNNPDQFADAIRRLHKHNQTNNKIIQVEEYTRFFAEDFAGAISMVGKSRATVDTLRMLKIVAESCCNPVLILGETGTGKEIAAKGIHLLRHPDEKLVAVNCAALTSTLLESELFGHVKGAFTGADCDKIGLLEMAGQGTILLDEISEMPLQLQAKLLRVLEEKQFRKVGGTKSIACNATIIAASNRNIAVEVRENRFRRDLYYRLNISPITLAPLRSQHRRDDICLLAEYFLRTSTICPAKSSRIKSLTSLAAEALARHDWPGNVRELRNVIERAILLETTDKIGLSDISFELPDGLEPTLEVSRYFTGSEVGVKNITFTGNKIDFSLEKAERELISRALLETNWQKTRAADLLGITRATLYAKLKQYNIEKQQNETSYFTEQPDNDFTLSYQ
jgi:DNA-binding NtrC family response regulator